MVQEAGKNAAEKGQSLLVVTYGMGVHWALNAAKKFPGQVEIFDLRTIFPLVQVVTEEAVNNSFAQSLAARIQEHCFEWLDAPVRTVGSENMPAIPLNETLERTMIPSIEKVEKAIADLLAW